jgi:transposase
MSKKRSTPSGGGGRIWPAYDAAQMSEKSLFLAILLELCKEIEEKIGDMGRRPLRLRDMVLCLVFKVYSMKSARRFTDDLREIHAKGLIESVPSPTSIGEYMRSEYASVALRDLLVKSSLPLSEAESVFAVDSTGFSLPRRRVWFNKHTKRRQRKRDHMKLHAMIGVKTGIITYVEPIEGSASDMNYLRHLVAGTARHFDISEVSADAGYISGENLRTVLLYGGIPYIAFKKNNALDADYKSTIWKDLLYLWKTKHPLFTEHYFLRNNVEAAFHSMKSKFGGRLRSKSTAGQFNEALAKALCHNVCVLIRSMCELGIDPLSWAEKHPRSEVKGITIDEAVRHQRQRLLEIKNAVGDRELPPEGSPRRRSRRAKTRKSGDRPSDQVRLFD